MTREILEKRIEDAEYWAGKNGYEQEAIRELLIVTKILVNELYKSEYRQQTPYTSTGSDYLDCVLGVGGFEQYGPIKGDGK